MASKHLPPLPEDVAALQAMVRHYEGELSRRDAVIAQQQETMAEQLAEIQLLLARRFGQASEKVNEAQLGLFNEAEVEADTAGDEDRDDDSDAGDEREVKGRTRKRGKRQPLPSHLPRVEVVHDLTEDEKFCPRDGTALEVVDDERSEQLRIIPAKSSRW